VSVYYSGTVGAARESFFTGISSMAVSLCDHEATDFSFAADVAVEVFESFLLKSKEPLLLNVNIPQVPPKKHKGIICVKQAASVFVEEYAEPKKGFFSLSGFMKTKDVDLNDESAIQKGFTAVTPLSIDETDYAMMERMKETLL